MMQYSKTAWCEGMFLRPQHFQQHERAISNEYKGLHSLGGSYTWGVWNCRVKEHALKTGLIELDNLQAILPDMTLIDFSATTSFLSPLKVKKRDGKYLSEGDRSTLKSQQ